MDIQYPIFDCLNDIELSDIWLFKKYMIFDIWISNIWNLNSYSIFKILNRMSNLNHNFKSDTGLNHQLFKSLDKILLSLPIGVKKVGCYFSWIRVEFKILKSDQIRGGFGLNYCQPDDGAMTIILSFLRTIELFR